MMERSDFAPVGWRMDQTEAMVRAAILKLDPDFVLFQELPGLIPFIETHDMVPANARGQSGDIATLARRELMPDIEASRVKNAVLTTLKSADLTIANVHLPSGRGGASARSYAVEDIIAANKASHLAVVGDTNTRTREEADFKAMGLVGKRPPEPTWNGRIGKFRMGAKEYTAYFTRAFHSRKVKIDEQKVLIDPVEIGGSEFHLSDHFALWGRISEK